MKLDILQENLAKGLIIVGRTISTRAQLPILSNVLLATDQGRLRFSATNLETGINFWAGAKIIEKGEITVPAKTLAEFVTSLPAEKVSLETKENSLKISCGAYQADLVGLSSKEFPAIPSAKQKPSLTVSDLAAAVPQVAFAAAQDESRPVLAGVLVSFTDQGLQLVATDGYRLSVKKINGIKNSFKETKLPKNLIIPGWALTEVVRIIGGGEEVKPVGLEISLDANQIIFVMDEAEVISRLIEGEFPDFAKVIPPATVTKIILEKESFLRAVRMAAIFARESANIVKFKIAKNKLTVSANAAQVGENISELEAVLTGKENQIAFNSRYLIEFLNNTPGEQISLEMNDRLSPGIFKAVGDDSYLHIIMPVRVQE